MGFAALDPPYFAFLESTAMHKIAYCTLGATIIAVAILLNMVVCYVSAVAYNHGYWWRFNLVSDGKSPDDRWHIWVWDSPLLTRLYGMHLYPESVGDHIHDIQYFEEKMGYPWRSMKWGRHEWRLHNQVRRVHVYGAADLWGSVEYEIISAPHHPAMAMPTIVVWPGFIANTVVYSVFLLIPFLVFHYGRRKYRCHAGKCVDCGYELKGSVSRDCPECGWNRPAGEGEAPASAESNETRT